MREYRNYFVAFLDILGFKNLLKTYECDALYDIFDVIHNRAKASLEYNGVTIDAYEKLEYKILSDSVVLYIDASIDDSFAALLDICHRLQFSLLYRKSPILLRGGIAYGKLYVEDDVIFGDGLTTAYLLESNLAKYPRVIFTDDTLSEGRRTRKNMLHAYEPVMRTYDRDEDELYFLTYRPLFTMKPELYKPYLDVLVGLCNKNLNKLTDAGLREKYLWLRKLTNKIIKMFPTIQEKYDEENKQKRAAYKKDLDERIAKSQENINE